MKKSGTWERLTKILFRKVGSSSDVTVQPGTVSASTIFQLPPAGGGTETIVVETSASLTGKVNKSGDTMSGNLAFSGGAKITGLPAPTGNGEALRYDQLGANSGIATLDGSGKIPVAQLPNSVMEFQGTWNASTNSTTPGSITLADGTGNIGDVWWVTTAGTQNLGSGSQSFVVGDYVIYTSSGIWTKVHAGADSVVSVNGYSGVVSLVTDDIAEDGSPVNLWFTDARARAAISILDTSSIDFSYNSGTGVISGSVLPAGVDHNSLANLATGDVHTHYALLAGRSSGQTLKGGTASGEDLILQSTNDTTKGHIQVKDGSELIVGNNVDNVLTLALNSGHTAGAPAFPLHIATTAPAPVGGAHIGLTRISNSSGGSSIMFSHSRGTGASPSHLTYTSVSSSDIIMSLASHVYDGTYLTNQYVGDVIMRAAENHVTGTNYGTRFVVRTTTNASASAVDAVSVENNGSVVINPTSAAAKNTGHFQDNNFGGVAKVLVSNTSKQLVESSLAIGDLALATLANLGSVAINTTLVSDTDNTDDLGTSAIGWKEGFINKISMDSAGFTTSIEGSASAAASVAYKLPVNAPADNGYVLASTTGGVMSWVSNASVSSAKANWTDLTSAVTFTHGTDVVNWTAHGLVNGQAFYFTNSGGGLPAGVSDNTIYYVVSSTANTFQFAATYNGSAILFADDGTGTHTANVTSYALSHSLATTDIMDKVQDIATGFKVEMDEVIVVSSSLVIFNATALPGGSGYRVMAVAV